MDTNKKIKIYLAGGWFSKFQDEALSFLEEFLSEQENFIVYAPRKDAKLEGAEGVEAQKKVFELNCTNIDDADIVIASTVDKDMGTLWECGYAYKAGKPIIYTLFDIRFKDAIFNLMLARSGVACYTFNDISEFIEDIMNLNSQGLSYLKLIKPYEGGFE